jgi:plastocyanin
VWLLAGAGLHSDLVMAQQDADPVASAAPNQAGLGADDVVVEVSGMTFSPTVVTIEPGQTITWMRRSGFHNVAADDGSYRSGEVGDTWDTFSHTFVAPGEYPYHCELHGGVGGVGMAGKVIVQVSGQSGSKLFLPILAH